MMAEPLLSVQALSSGYGDVRVVDGVTFDVMPGEIFGLVGLNGAGKTTLIKTIIGLRQKFEGDFVLQDGKQFSYLPERFEPPWFLKGQDFIRFSLKFYNKEIGADVIESAAKDISLDIKYLDEYVHSYSKGMRQKLGLLATILTGCSLLILDEPMSGLDPKARQEVKQTLLKAKSEGRSIFLSSHILADVAELCDKVAVFHDKSIVFLGTPDELSQEGGDDNPEKAFLSILAA